MKQGTASQRAPAPRRRGRPTAENSRLKTAHLLAVAKDMFAELGYRAVTMRKVAETAQVSTRTLYDRFSDKLSLFEACLDFGSVEFPQIGFEQGVPPEKTLRWFAAALVRTVSADSSVRLSVVVSREGMEFPELVRAADAIQEKYLVRPLARYMVDAGIAGDEAKGDEQAKLFLAMAFAEWQRRFAFHQPLPKGQEIERHAEAVVDLFLHGAVHKD